MNKKTKVLKPIDTNIFGIDIKIDSIDSFADGLEDYLRIGRYFFKLDEVIKLRKYLDNTIKYLRANRKKK